MCSLTEKEFDYIVSYLDNNEGVRISTRLFVYSALIAFEGLLMEGTVMPSYFLLIPYLVLIPLACKITYSRICHARLNALLSVGYPEWRIHQNPSFNVYDLDSRNPIDWVIKYCINLDVAFISLSCSVITIWRAWEISQCLSPSFVALTLISLALFAITVLVQMRGLNYRAIKGSYIDKWSRALLENSSMW